MSLSVVTEIEACAAGQRFPSRADAVGFAAEWPMKQPFTVHRCSFAECASLSIRSFPHRSQVTRMNHDGNARNG
jgi:hypothetical protein